MKIEQREKQIGLKLTYFGMCEKFFLWSFLHSYIFFNFFVIHAHPVQKEIADVIPLEITWFSFIWLTLFLSLDANTYTKLNLYIFQETWTIVQSYSIHYDMLIFHHQNLSFILKNFKFDSKRFESIHWYQTCLLW